MGGEKKKGVMEVLEKNGLQRGEHGLMVNKMAEIPSNVFLADKDPKYSDGFPIGGNDLTQLTLGHGRDPGLVAQYFDGLNPAVMNGLARIVHIRFRVRRLALQTVPLSLAPSRQRTC